MSPQIVLVLAAVLLLVAVLGVVLRTNGRGRSTARAAETPAEPASEGMHVVADGEISPGPRSE